MMGMAAPLAARMVGPSVVIVLLERCVWSSAVTKEPVAPESKIAYGQRVLGGILAEVEVVYCATESIGLLKLFCAVPVCQELGSQ